MKLRLSRFVVLGTVFAMLALAACGGPSGSQAVAHEFPPSNRRC